ncbi:nickel/cobalt transporter [Breoghania sp.]|uniref:nickel/cobalt transporter n=1 Tax=Breoghania sp. TaxID=2065378 RepID=UPI00260E2C36|nr:nickel/cobalt transporter [Breoghania sp.]MDJ0930434.1 nickel/cobalt transporter [Breoghania sp.]
MTEALQSLKADGSVGWWLAGLSFICGVFHAAGPGHGKAVISTYVLVNRQTIKKAVALSFTYALAQAVMAITKTTEIFEIGSYALIVGLGGWMIWTKALHGSLRLSHGSCYFHDHEHHHVHHGHGENCSCGHSHAPDPAMLEKPVTLARAWSVILAVGLRPCTGALIILVFALSQGLVIVGIASTFVMALGTGLTVSVLAVFAVTARGLAMRFAGEGSALAYRLHRMVEIGGSVLVFLLGLVLLTAAIGWR